MTIGPVRQNLDVIEAAARRAAEDALQGTGADWEFVVRSGDPAHELMAMAGDRPPTAIVVGGRPHKAALSGLAGSVGAALVHRFHGSVLVVRGGDPRWNAASASGSPSGRRHLSPLTPQIGEHHVVVRSDLPRTAPS